MSSSLCGGFPKDSKKSNPQSTHFHISENPVISFTQRITGAAQLLQLLRCQGKGKDPLYPVLVDNTGNSGKYVHLTVLSPQHGGYGKYAVLIPQNGLGYSGKGHANAIISGTLGLYDFVSGSADIFLDFIKPLPAYRLPVFSAQLQYGLGGQQCLAPRHKLAVPMLSHDIGMDISGIRLQIIA